MEVTTDSLRELAPRWSLAGDDKLLTLLQSTHQKIISKCQEVNTKLDTMAMELDEASISLQNVNNKFMALSNSQFIESRVYDDDADVSTDIIPVEEPPKPEAIDEITLLKRSLAVLDDAHETAEIMDDTDTDDSDALISVVLKPKDAYAHRPLPYIIGSQAWKNKWHAGLVIEDSDSDSTTSRQEIRDPMEQYSDSDEDVPTDKHLRDTTLSESSSSFSSRDKEPSAPENRAYIPEVKSPAAVAAELAARLGQISRQVIEESEEDLSPLPTSKTVYRPQKPVSSTIFSDEPPPLDPLEQYSSQEEDDIFAEINKKQPYNKDNRAYNDDLFGTPVAVPVTDFTNNKVENKSANQKSTLFEDESEPELFVETKPKESTQNTKNYENDNSTKKPVGGISLFGSNKGTESIGAAILNRNRRKSSTSESEDDSHRNTIKNDPAVAKDESDNASNPNDIFDNLFAKAKLAEQKAVKSIKIDRPVKEEDRTKPKEIKDLFSDDIFDDIDDIFTSNIKIPPKAAKNTKSIFDDVDDDLFTDIAKEIPKDIKATSSIAATSSRSVKKSIFDSDEDLFSDIKVKKTDSATKNINPDDKKPTITDAPESQNIKPKSTIKEDNNNIKDAKLTEKRSISEDSPKFKQKEEKIKAQSKSIFDSDSDDGLFSDVKNKTAKPIEKIQESNKNSTNIDSEIETELFKEMKETKVPETLKTIENPKTFQSPSLFEEDEIDDLFINANKAKEDASLMPKNANIEPDVTKDIPGFINKSKLFKDSPDFKDQVKADIKPKVIKEVIKPVDTKSNIIPKPDNPKIKSHQLFDDNLQEDYLFTKPDETANENIFKEEVIETSQEPIAVQSRSISISSTVEPKLQKPDSADDNKNNIETESKSSYREQQESNSSGNDTKINKLDSKVETMFDEVPVKEKRDILHDEKIPVSLAAAFDDIFSEPPAFEKTKETKKTVNVNALFEDDSDDEALFFKKDDVISDEKPEIFSPSAVFGLFNDEPPDFDVDFIPKANKNDQNDDLFSSASKRTEHLHSIQDAPPELDEWDNEPINDTPFTKPTEKRTNQFSDDSENHLFSSPDIRKETKPIINKAPRKQIPDSDDELNSTIPKSLPSQKENLINIDQPKEINTDEVNDIEPDIKRDIDKKIGKLNTKNFNINVQALVPGASPKKTPKESTDSEIINSNKDDFDGTSNENDKYKNNKDEESKTEVDNAEPKSKTIGFKSKPESGVLDNNLSKQRARIQVKRRPSSRRARHEAVRKSVIDLDDDTDNSNSFDEPKPKNVESYTNKQKKDSEYEIPTILKDKTNEYKNQVVDRKTSNDNILNLDDTVSSTNILNEEKILNIHNEITKDTVKTNKTSSDAVDSKNTSNIEINKDFTPKIPENPNKTQNEENFQKSPQSTTKIVYVLNDEDIFTNKTENHDEKIFKNNEGIDFDEDLFQTGTTTGSTYKETTKKTKDTTTKNTTYTDSKSSQNIEYIKKDTESSKKVQPQAKSLFDLSDDDDDLFGKSTRTKKVETKTKLFESDSEDDLFSGKKEKIKEIKKEKDTKVKEVKNKSLFGDDDDDDLFGVKTIPISEPGKILTTATKSTHTTKSTEVVFDDPLTMLDDD